MRTELMLPAFDDTADPEVLRDRFGDAMKEKGASHYVAAVTLYQLHASGQYQLLGYRSIDLLAAKVAGVSKSYAYKLISVGKALRSNPSLDDAYRNREIPFCRVLLLAKVIHPDNAEAWIDKAKKLTTTQLEREVKSVRDPVTPPDRIPLGSTTFDIYTKLQAVCQRLRTKNQNPHLSDDDCLEQACDLALESLETPPPETAHEPNDPTSRHIPTHIARNVRYRAGHRCETYDCGSTDSLELHHVIPYAEGGKHTARNLRLFCAACHAAGHKTVHSQSQSHDETRATNPAPTRTPDRTQIQIQRY